MTDRRTIFGALDDLAAHYRLVLGAPLVAAALTAGIVLVWPPTYASTASFVPESRTGSRLPAGLAGLASQFGFGLGAEPSRSPSFYADLLRSREVLSAVLAASLADPQGGGDSITVYQLYRIAAPTPARKLDDGVGQLRSRITVAVDQRTDVVRLTVEAPDPRAARDVAALLLKQLTSFNVDTRQSIARNRRQFVEGRVTASEHELRTAEDALRAFYESNRQWQNSPQLRFDEQRLSRQVTVQQEMYLTLRREYEAARIEEVNNTPVLTMIDHPQVPGRRIRPQRTLTVLLVTLIVALLAGAAAIAAERHRDLIASGEPEYQRLRDRLIRLRAGGSRFRDIPPTQPGR